MLHKFTDLSRRQLYSHYCILMKYAKPVEKIVITALSLMVDTGMIRFHGNIDIGTHCGLVKFMSLIQLYEEERLKGGHSLKKCEETVEFYKMSYNSVILQGMFG